MAAEDTGDALASVEQGSGDLSATPSGNPLAPVVRDWLAARIETSARPVLLSIAALPGRYLIRAELGGAASSLDWPSAGETSAVEFSNAVRRWARSRSLPHRVESARSSEARIAFTPAATHS